MALFDWLKEIPLSAVLKERLADSEKKALSMEKENSSLKEQIQTLNLLLEQCQEQRRTLENQISEKRHKTLLDEQALSEKLNQEIL